MSSTALTTYFNHMYVLVRGLQRTGWAYESACQLLSLPTSNDKNFKVPIELLTNSCNRINEALESKAACFTLGFNIYPVELGHTLKLGRFAQTLGEGIFFTLCFQRLFNNALSNELSCIHGELALEQQVHPELSEDSLALQELRMAIVLQQAHFSLGKLYHYQQIFDRIEFAHSPQAPLAEYQAACAIPIHFNCPRTAIYFKPGAVQISMPGRDREAFAYQLNKMWQIAAEQELCPVDKLTLFALTHSPINRITRQNYAEASKLSEHTIDKALHMAGTTFEKVIEQARVALASCYLLSSQRGIEQLSQTLGYPDLDSFSLNFHRVRGLTPEQYLKQFNGRV